MYFNTLQIILKINLENVTRRSIFDVSNKKKHPYTMKTTGIKVKEVSAQDMLNNEAEAAYNPTEWKKGVTRMAQLKNVKFYEAEKNEHYRYARFYVSYTLPEGLNIFAPWSPFLSSLTNNGFKKIIIIDGEIFVKGFGPEDDMFIINNKDGRKWLAEIVCKHGVFVSTQF